MIDLKKIQKDVFQNKIEKGFNTMDVNKEFCYAYGELGEAFDAYRKKKDDLGEELADVVIYLLGLSEMLGLDLEEEIERKVAKNGKRKYVNIDGVNMKIEE
jgi:NTP pyrophosphatase (non-canonical NTP hydrolase)